MIRSRCWVFTLFSPLLLWDASCFSPVSPAFLSSTRDAVAFNAFFTRTRLFDALTEDNFPDDDEEDEEDEGADPYTEAASSEFLDNENSSLAHPTTTVDWGGALGTLRDRIGDQETGRVGPSNALFRSLTSESPNEAITSFVSKASPQVVTAMSSAVTSLLGGLTNPSMGIETVVKASGEKIGNLCFQLQMTGYMFRNAEYVLALKDLMNIHGSASLEDYREAFDRLDSDKSGFIEAGEIEALLGDVYGDDKPPAFEVESFMRFFDENDDGRISWAEFERGLGAMAVKNGAKAPSKTPLLQSEDGGETDTPVEAPEPSVSGNIEVELKDGTVIEVSAKDYINDLKKEAEALRMSLRREDGEDVMPGGLVSGEASVVSPPTGGAEGIATYISSLQGDVQSLTKGISPEVLDAMKLLVDYVIEGVPPSKRGEVARDKNQIEMEVPGAALQQLALWQLVLGYRLRESEATGEHLRMLE